MEKEEMVDICLKGSPQWILNIALACLLAVCSFPFLWIWHSWELSWKILLTGIIGFIIFGNIYLLIKREAEKYVNDIIEKRPQRKSKFQQKMEEMQRQAEEQKARKNTP